MAPATQDRSKLSVSSCRITRRRSAPNASRNAISRARALPRASDKLATFAHAISKRNATAPKSSRITGRMFPEICSCNGTRTASASQGSVAASCLPSATVSACACATLIPPFRRPTIVRKWLVFSLSMNCDVHCHGTQASIRGSRNRKPRGMTPMTVYLAPLSNRSCPTICGSAPKRRTHSA